MKVKVGNLPTINQDEYPGLGQWWLQLRNADNTDEVVLRVYADSVEEVVERANQIASAINALEAYVPDVVR